MENEFLRRLNNPDRPVICIGAWYTVAQVKEGITCYRKLRAVGKYEHHVLFEDEKGLKESIGWWQLARCVQ